MKKRISLAIWGLVLVAVIAITIFFGKDMLSKKPEVSTPAPQPTQSVTEPTEPLPPPIPAWATVLPEREIVAPHYFVYNTKTDSFVVHTDTLTTRIFPASITKLMSSLVALDYLKPQDMITVGPEVRAIDPDSSVAGLQQGDTLSFAHMLEAMLLPSGNDAATVVAVQVGRTILQNPNASIDEAKAAFVEKMNEKAENLGLSGSHFVTVDGIHDPNHYLTIRDLARLGELAMQNPLIRECVARAEGHNPRYDEEDENSPRQWQNTNLLLHPESPYYCPDAIGLKTGYTGAAGNCLLSAFRHGNTVYIVGVFGCSSSADRFADSVAVFTENVFF